MQQAQTIESLQQSLAAKQAELEAAQRTADIKENEADEATAKL